MIQSTTDDLKDHLGEIHRKLHSLTVQPLAVSATASLDLLRIQEEKETTEQCLQICANVSAHLESIRFLPTDTSTSDVQLSPRSLTRAQLITMSALKECGEKITGTVTQLQGHIGDVKHRLYVHDLQNEDNLNSDPEINAKRLEGERASAEQCLAICTQASTRASDGRVHVLEDISMAEDGQQVFVSTVGDLFRVKSASAGNRSVQFIGSVSEASLQHYLQLQYQRSAPKSPEPPQQSQLERGS